MRATTWRERPAGCGRMEASSRAERGSASWKAGGCGESVRPSAIWPQPCTPRKEKPRLSRGGEEHPYGDRGDAVPAGQVCREKLPFALPEERGEDIVFLKSICVF